MPKISAPTKKLQIDKANLHIVVATATAVFLTIFSIVACYQLYGQSTYQGKVITKKQAAKKQLQTNIQSAETLKESYEQFVSTPNNIIGGTSGGLTDRDGDNAKIVLDALPSRYDFPALLASIDKLVKQNGVVIESITGTDDEVVQLGQSESSGTPTPLEVPFEVGVAGDFASLEKLIKVFEQSIRPISVVGLRLESQQNTILMVVKAKTYYQPAKSINIKTQVVK